MQCRMWGDTCILDGGQISEGVVLDLLLSGSVLRVSCMVLGFEYVLS